MDKNILISSDMEGLPGVMTFDEVDKEHPDYQDSREIMTEEVKKISSILKKKQYASVVRDAHDTGRNIILKELDEDTTIIRGWNLDIKNMCYGINENTKGVILHAYHSAGGINASTVAHTINYETIEYIKLNGNTIGETSIAIYTCSLFNTPVFFITGDKGAINEAKSINDNIIGLITKEFDDTAVISKTPKRVLLEINDKLDDAIKDLEKKPEIFNVKIPDELDFEIKFLVENHQIMKKPGVYKLDEKTIRYQTDNFKNFLELLK